MGKAEILQQWLNKANDDLRAAEYLSTMHHPTPDEIICFHCQQAEEKYLKAFIFIHDIEPEKTHDLEALLKICQEYNTSFSLLLSKLQFLNEYAVIPRYPNELGITNEDMRNAISCAKDVQKFVLEIFQNTEVSEG
jgi:HEPN domain-containing protein